MNRFTGLLRLTLMSPIINDNHMERTIDFTGEELRTLFGQNDKYLEKIEKELNVSIVNRNGALKISGDEADVSSAAMLMRQIISSVGKEDDLEEQKVDYALTLAKENNGEDITVLDKEVICHTVSGKPIKPKTLGQKEYVEAMKKNMVVFGIGPAGTGKTYLAMALAITAFKNNEVNKIILTRPAIEAGEKLGFLPGDLQSKVDPYLRPLYDALYQIMGAEGFQKNMEKGLIEVAPLAYMRGRTLDDAYIILDEAQNTTPAQMKMFLTRIGFGSKVVITGDSTQKDLPKDVTSGLDVAIKILNKIEGIAVCNLTSKDVVRHPLVQKIVKGYETYEEKDPILTTEYVTEAAKAYISGQGGFEDERFSPLFGRLNGLPPVYIMAGQNEILLDDSSRLHDQILKNGGTATLDIEEDGWHVYQQMPIALATQAMKRLSAHVSSVIYGKAPD